MDKINVCNLPLLDVTGIDCADLDKIIITPVIDKRNGGKSLHALSLKGLLSVAISAQTGASFSVTYELTCVEESIKIPCNTIDIRVAANGSIISGYGATVVKYGTEAYEIIYNSPHPEGTKSRPVAK